MLTIHHEVAMETITYREAARRALRKALQDDQRVFIIGEDVGRYGGSYAVTRGFLEEFGPERIRDAPLSEGGFTGLAIGAALGGMRPIVEIMTVNFSLLALDQIVNNAATLSHMSGGQLQVPLVIRMASGAGRQLAAQHSHSWEGWYAHIPGLKILTPATVMDVYGMLLQALRDPNPVLIFEHAQLYGLEGAWEEEGEHDIEHARILREGEHLTLVTYGGSLPKAQDAVRELEKAGLSIELIDLRVLRPLDDDTILRSVRKTHRVLIVDEGWKSGSLAAEITARIMEQAFFDLDAPVRRLCSAEVPIPYSRHLENFAVPQVETIVSAAREVVGTHVGI
jgi:pyruvate dehydrogenase E1 component beta subunit